jgi:branched-chain amino acid transport system substrate-binding protein
MTQTRHLVLCLLAAALLAGCGPRTAPFECSDAIGCVEVAPGQAIKLGVVQNLSGSSGPPGLSLVWTAEFAVEDRGGELLDHTIQLQTEDSLCSGEGGTTAALKIAADPQMVGIIGPTCSGAAATAMKVVSDSGLVMISGSSSAPSLTSVGGEQGANWQPGFYRTSQNDALAGQSAATFAFQVLGVTEAATINDGDLYTRGLTDTFEKAFTELGGEIVLSTAVNKGDSDMRPVLNAVATSGAELVFLPIFSPEADRIVLQARELEELEDVTLMSAEGSYFDSFIQAVGKAGIGMYFNTPAQMGGPAYDTFLSSFERVYGMPPTDTPYHAHLYDAVNLLLNAIESVAIVEQDGTLHIGRQALRDALYATSGFQGLTGSLTCDEYGDCGAIRLKVTRLEDPSAGLAGLDANVVYTYPPVQ